VRWSDSSIAMLLAISVFIVSISDFITFVGTSASASSDFNDFTIDKPPENTTDGSGLEIEGLAPQDEGDLSIACSLPPEQC
jgi:hypothetical protein